MRILLTGSSGLIGRAVLRFLTAQGHNVVRLTRSQRLPGDGQIFWDPAAGTLKPSHLEGFDAIVHLAGESIVGRWTAAKKARILESRAKGTRLLCDNLARLTERPAVLVSASAIGFYGNRGDEILTENSSAGPEFLAEVAKAWEAATEPAAATSIRVVTLRIGFVLSKDGGGLSAMLLPFRLGLGGRIGSGRQYISWIAIDDVVGAVVHALSCDALHGPVNAVTPKPVTNLEFTKALGRALSRPTVLPLPAFAARLVMGELADALLLSSTRVEPARLLASGYKFQFPDLQGALRNVLGRS